jgi:hypothetical protein
VVFVIGGYEDWGRNCFYYDEAFGKLECGWGRFFVGLYYLRR